MKRSFLFFALLFYVPFAFAQASEEAINVNNEIRLAVNGGYSYRLARVAPGTPSILRNYVNNLKSGYAFGLDAAYFFKPERGLGLKYSRFGSEASMNNMTVTYDNGNSSYGTISDDIAITFVGPSYVTKYPLANQNHSLFGSLSLGYLQYNDHGKLANEIIELKGSTFGAAIDLGYDYSISRYMKIGAQASLTGGSLSKLTQVNGGYENTIELEGDDRENLSRLDITAGVRFKI